MAYVDIEYVKRGSMPAIDVEELEAQEPGLVEALAAEESAYADSFLGKRYRVPFSPPYPEALRRHVRDLVVYRLYAKRGYPQGTSRQDEVVKNDRDEAEAWLREAANSQTGLVEIGPPNATEPEVTRGGPLSYSESSPYEWTDVQREERGLEGGRRGIRW